MYAIIEAGGKQYRVEKGTRLNVEKIPQDAGAAVEFSQVLLVGSENGSPAKIGQPYVPNTKVSATILKHFRAPKVIIFKKRPKKGYKKMQGHRQNLTQIEIKEIAG
ncbi:MAG: 50S ribosomal protein L21 [Elusimicrobia bacterium]|nr:50S ribosomal protein L21 [Elusimicrobiota bacterium]